MRRFTSFVAVLLAAAASLDAACAAETMFPPGSRIGLQPPADMVPAKGISGFRNPKTGVAIVTIEMPAEAYPSIAASFADEALKAQGFTLKSRETVKIGQSEAILISGEQHDSGRVVPKTLLLAADPGMTALVIAQAPSGAAPSSEEELRSALKTVTFRPPLSMDDQIAALPFRLADLAGFRPIRVMSGNSVLLTDGPNEAVRQAEQPIMIVAQSFASAPAADQRDTFARQVLVSNTVLTETVLERSQGFRQGGTDWHEIVAKAKDGHSNVPVVVLQTIRFSPDGYLRMVGVVKAEDRDAVMPRFRKIVDAVAPK
jgi:hypothetical protein